LFTTPAERQDNCLLDNRNGFDSTQFQEIEMKSMQRVMLLMVSLALLASLVVGCVAAPASPTDSAPAAPSEGPQMGGTVIGFVSSDPKSFDPAAIAGWDQGVIAPNLLEGLFRLSPDGREIEPAIAESFDVTDDGTTWTFHLRAGAKFHNGRVITADDFKYSFERVLNPETRSPKAWMLSIVVGAQAFQDGSADEVSGIRVVDAQTLEIELAAPLAPFKSMLASINLAVVPQEEVEKWGEDFGQNVVSAGPFSLGEWNLNQDVTLNAFEDYWNGRPYLDAVMFRFIGDENTRIVELDAGRLDMAWVPPAHWERFSTDPVFKEKLGWAETFHTDFIAVNLEKEPFGANPKLRQAVRYALDLDAIIASLQGRATVAQGLLPPGLLGFDEDAMLSYPTNLDSAKALMAEAGFADGVPGTFEVILPPWGNLIKMLEIYQANLKEIGINIEIRPTEFGPYMEALETGSYDLAWMYRVTDYADPDGFYFPLMHSDNLGAGGNYARYANSDVDANIAAARATVDDAERTTLYQAVDAQFAEDLPYIPLTHNIYVDVSRPRVQNYVPSPMDTHMFHRVWVEE
jgi:peptide/nickel transport system substrate-binding protein/oligopeptide transport system substrate-binding protein